MVVKRSSYYRPCLLLCGFIFFPITFQAATKKQKYEKISEKKMSTPVEVLCKVNSLVLTFKCSDRRRFQRFCCLLQHATHPFEAYFDIYHCMLITTLNTWLLGKSNEFEHYTCINVIVYIM